VEDPAQPHRKVDGQHLVHDLGVQGQQRHAAQQDGRNAQHRTALLFPEVGGRDRAQPIDHMAHDGEQQCFVHRQQGRSEVNSAIQPRMPWVQAQIKAKKPLGGTGGSVAG
jgi:hypothetical protein